MSPSPLMFIGSPGWMEIVLILAVILLLFGSRKLPEIMGSFGKGVRKFKKEINKVNGELDDDEKQEKEEPARREKPEGETRPGEKPGDGGEA